jgi:hypothetical protein
VAVGVDQHHRTTEVGASVNNPMWFCCTDSLRWTQWRAPTPPDSRWRGETVEMPCEIAGRSSWGWSKRKSFHPERISDGIHSLDSLDSLDLCIQNDCEDCLVAHLMNVRISWISTGIFSNCVETIPVLTTAHMISCAFVLSFV